MHQLSENSIKVFSRQHWLIFAVLSSVLIAGNVAIFWFSDDATGSKIVAGVVPAVVLAVTFYSVLDSIRWKARPADADQIKEMRAAAEQDLTVREWLVGLLSDHSELTKADHWQVKKRMRARNTFLRKERARIDANRKRSSREELAASATEELKQALGIASHSSDQ